MTNINSFTELRLRLGLSIENVADITGYSQRAVYRWEKNEIKPRKPVVEQLLRLAQSPAVYGSSSYDFTFIDLFAGIGGMRKAFDDLGGKCVFTKKPDALDNRWTKQAQLNALYC